jgi:hypothetical protein
MDRTKHLMTQVILTISVLFVYFIQLSRERPRIVESLKSLSPLFLEIILVLFVGLLVYSAGDLARPFKSITKKQWILVGLIVLFAFSLAFFAAPRTHRIYYDENIYLHIGQSIAHTHKAQMINFGEIKYGEFLANQGEYNKQPNAYPVFLSLFYRVFGESETLSFVLTNVFFALGALVVLLIGYLLSGHLKIGIYAALAYSIIPQNILWHNTTAVEPANTFFIALTVLLFLVFLKTESLKLFFPAMVLACFTAQFRMESILIFPLLLLFLLINKPKLLKEQKYYYIIPLVLILLLPHIMHILSFQGHSWGATGQAKYSLKYFAPHLKTNGMFFLKNRDFPLLITLFALLAFVAKGDYRKKIKLLVWFLCFWGLFLFFYAGSYYWADIRFVLMVFPPLSLLAGYGLWNVDRWFKKRFKKDNLMALILIAAAFLSFAPRARMVGQEAWAARWDHHYAKAMLDYLPRNAIIFTHNPNMFLFWGQSAAQASILSGQDANGLQGLEMNFPGGIYFHFNFWCNVSDPLQQSFCQGIIDKFSCTEVVSYRERDYTYTLFRVEAKRPIAAIEGQQEGQ